MLRTRGVLVIVLLLSAVGARPVRGQDRPAAQVTALRDAFEQLDYEAAEAHALAILEAYQRYTPEQLTEVHVILAQIKYAQNDLAAARRQFVAALQLTPDLELDPLLVSPKILAFFEDVSTDVARGNDGTQPPEPDATPRYIFVADPRPEAALRSMLLPGWGQHFKGQTGKGWVLTGLWTATAGGTAVVHVLRGRAEDRYLHATDDFDARFDTFNRLHKLRNVLLVSAVGVWAFSYVDALLGVAPQAPDDRRLTVGPARRGIGIGMRLRY